MDSLFDFLFGFIKTTQFASNMSITKYICFKIFSICVKFIIYDNSKVYLCNAISQTAVKISVQ